MVETMLTGRKDFWHVLQDAIWTCLSVDEEETNKVFPILKETGLIKERERG